MPILRFFLVLILISCTAADKKMMMDTAGAILGGSAKNPSSQEVGLGLKQALTKGIQAGAFNASKRDGFLKNQLIKITLPPEAKEAEKGLRKLGLGNLADQAMLSMNRAAEDAAKASIPIFTSAITSLKFQDVMNILMGQDNAATSYLQKTTNNQLVANFKPKIANSLKKVSATKHWAQFADTYNKIPFIKKMDVNLENYVTQRAIVGLFSMVAKEELKIRKEPVARTTDLLKRVFSLADAKKTNP